MAIDSDSDYASSDDESEVDETEFTCENVRVAPRLSDCFLRWIGFGLVFRPFVSLRDDDGEGRETDEM